MSAVRVGKANKEIAQDPDPIFCEPGSETLGGSPRKLTKHFLGKAAGGRTLMAIRTLEPGRAIIIGGTIMSG